MRTAPGASALLALLCLASPASALGWLDAPRDRRFAGPPPDAALAFLREQPGHADLHLETTATLRAPVGVTVRLRQRWRGLPVLGAQAAVRVLPGGRVSAATSTLAPRLALDTVEPALTQADAMALAGSLVGRDRGAVRAPRLAVLPEADAPGGGWLVWEATARGARGGERLVIDARSGRVRARQMVDRHVKGRVYETSVLKTPTPVDVELPDLDATNPPSLTGFNGQLSAYQYQSGGEEQLEFTASPVATDPDGNFLYNPPTQATSKTDEFAVVNSYYHVNRIWKFYTNELGVDMSSPAWRLGVVANLLDDGSFYGNAFFSPLGLASPATPNLIGIGQSPDIDFAYDSDVFIHEFTHYVSGNAIDFSDGQFGVDSYGLTAFGGSIDEGISDFFACTVNGDPILGEAALGQFARDLSAPSAFCSAGLSGEVHEDGKIIGQAAWAIRGLLGQALADQVIWGGFSLLEKGTSLQDFATAVLATTDDLVGAGALTAEQRAQVAQEFASRGLDDCGRVLSLNTDGRVVNMFGLGTVGQFLGASCEDFQGQVSLSSSFHFSYRPEPGANRIRISATMSDLEGGFGDLEWAIHGRVGQHVSFVSTELGFPEVGFADFTSDTFFSESGELLIGDDPAAPLDPDQTYYFVVTHKNCPYTQLFVEGASEVGPPPVGGAGGQSGASGSSGQSGQAGAAGAGAAGQGGAGQAGQGAAGLSGGSGQAGQSGAAAGGKAGAPPQPAQGSPGLEGVSSSAAGDGCGCRSAGTAPTPGGAAVWLASLAVVARRRVSRGRRTL